MSLRVIKVGGSLLQTPDLAERIQKWLRTVSTCQNVFVMGGGNFCHELRVLHQRYDLSETISHDLCLQQMVVTSQLLANLLQIKVVDEVEQIKNSRLDLVFDCRQWMSSQQDVPQSWDVTSDSISALLATELECALCLLKSVDAHEVDNYFSKAAENVPQVSFFNLRKV